MPKNNDKRKAIASAALKVAAALEDKTRWCKLTFARNVKGRAVHPKSPEATRWCAMGHAERLLSLRVSHDLFDAYIVEYGDMAGDNDAGVNGRLKVIGRLRQLAAILRKSKAKKASRV